MREEELVMRDGHRLFYRVWTCPQPRATVHINHGMAEHSARYDDFASALVAEGFAVYAQDHRGHGRTCEEDERGWFSEKDGWSLVADDAFALDKKISLDYPGIPHFVFGHSMGSFVTRVCISRHTGYYAAAVICGTGAGQGLMGRIGQFIARRHMKKWGSRMRDQDMDKLAFSSYDRHFKGEGPFSWLSRDDGQVSRYKDDPMCGFVCSSGFYNDLIELSFQANDKAGIGRVDKNLPILIISGADDPVGGYSKGVSKVFRLYRDAGIKDVRLKLYDGARHEILNETNKDEVYRDIISFYNGVLGK